MSISAPERQRLQQIDSRIERRVEKLRRHAVRLQHGPAIDGAHGKRLKETAHRLVEMLDEALPPTLDPRALSEVRSQMLRGMVALDRIDDERPLDFLNDLIVRAEAVRHLFRDMLDEDIGPDARRADLLTQQLVEWLPRVQQKELAEVVGVNPRTLQRWLKEGGEAPRRLEVVARLVAVLRHAWTPEGVIAWFYRRRPELSGRRPIDLLDDPGQEAELFLLVRQGRAQHDA